MTSTRSFPMRDMGKTITSRPSVASSSSLLLGLALAMVIHTVIHEAGHLIFGLATGYRFISYRVFQFMWIKQGGRIRFTRMSLAGTGVMYYVAVHSQVSVADYFAFSAAYGYISSAFSSLREVPW